MQKTKKYKVFRIFNAANGKIYIGVSSNPTKIMSQQLSGHGSALIAKDVKEFGREAFIRQVIDEFDTPKEANTASQTLIVREGSLFPSGYNLTIGGQRSKGYLWNAEQLEKISGSNSKKNKLTEEQVVKIFHDSRKYKKIAKDYSVSEVMISKIKNRKVWRHVTTWL